MGYYDDYLEHKLGGWTRKNHKYTSRYKDKKGKWRYVYGNAKNSVRRKMEDISDKVKDRFDWDYDHVLDMFDDEVKPLVLVNVRTEDFMQYNRAAERLLSRYGTLKDWRKTTHEDRLKIYDEWGIKAEKQHKKPGEKSQKQNVADKVESAKEEVQKKASKYLLPPKFVQGNHFQNLPRQKNPSGKTYGYYKKISTGNGKYRYFYSEAEYSRYMKRTSTLDKDYQFMQDVPVLSHKDSAGNAAKVADVGTDLGNCSSCSVAFEMRMRGYDVKARDDIDGKSTEEICKMFDVEHSVKNNWYVDTSREENSNYNFTRKLGFFTSIQATSEEERLQIAQNDLERSIKERGGDNQRGLMFINWTQSDPDENGQRHRNGGGHVFNYVVTDGEVKFYDAQKGETNNQTGGEIDIKEYLDNTDVTSHEPYRGNEDGWVTYNGFVRIDNKPLTEAGKENIQYEPVETHDTPRTKEDLDKR